MTKVDLKEIRKNGIYTVETNPAYNPNAEVFYYVFYFDVRSWGPRLKTLIKKRIWQKPVWLMPDDGENIYRLLVTNMSEFEQLCPQIEKLLNKESYDNTAKN